MRKLALTLFLLSFAVAAQAQSYAPIPDESGARLRSDLNNRLSGAVPISPALMPHTARVGAGYGLSQSLTIGDLGSDPTSVVDCDPGAGNTASITLPSCPGTGNANVSRSITVNFTHQSTSQDGTLCVVHTAASGQTINGYDASGSNDWARLRPLRLSVQNPSSPAWNEPKEPWATLTCVNAATTWSSHGWASQPHDQEGFGYGSTLRQIPAGNYDSVAFPGYELSCLLAPSFVCHATIVYSFFNATASPVWIRAGYGFSDNGLSGDEGNQGPGPDLLMPGAMGKFVTGATGDWPACTGNGGYANPVTATVDAYAGAPGVWWGANMLFSCNPGTGNL
jgi:hypothetical protein